MRHPGGSELALFAGGDLGLLERWRVRKHVRECSDCAAEVEALRDASEYLRELADEMPDSGNWSRLAAEMTGNIRVGLAAGECVGPVRSRKPRSLGWNAVAVMAAAFAIVIGALWINLPREQTWHLIGALRSIRLNPSGRRVNTPVYADSVVLEASQTSIDLTSNHGTMSLLTGRGDGAMEHGAVAVSVGMQGTAGAQYVDLDTGQVTISRVHYAQ